MTKPLIAVGDNCLDLFLTRGQMAFGGNALNVAMQWHRQGLAARYFGVTGTDEAGALMRAAVARGGLDVADMEERAGTTAVTLLQEKNGDRRFLLEDLGVGLHYRPDAARMAALGEAGWVHLGTNSAPELVRDLAGMGVAFSVDVSTRHQDLDLAGVALVLASGPDAEDAPVRPAIEALLARGASRVVLTCGARGAFFYDGSALLHQPAAPALVVDTCGAGDSFIAAFLAEHMVHARPAAFAMAAAALAAAETCGHGGGYPQVLGAIPQTLLDHYATTIAEAGS